MVFAVAQQIRNCLVQRWAKRACHGSISGMADNRWQLDQTDGELLVHTDVAGRAAKLGHRLTIAMGSWQGQVRWRAGKPTGVRLTADVDSLQVRRGEGGLTPLSPMEKILVRSNALKALDAGRYPQIVFASTRVTTVADGYRIAGTLEIHGQSRRQTVELHTEDLGELWGMSARVRIQQSEFGVQPYALLMGTLKVVDTVTVSFVASRIKS